MSGRNLSFPKLCALGGDMGQMGIAEIHHVRPSQVRGAASLLLDRGWFIETIACLDLREGILVNYFYAHFTEPGRIVVRTLVQREEPEVPSIADIFQGAEWHEREAAEMSGVRFPGNPNPLPLLLSEDEESHPLQKAFEDRKPISNIVDEFIKAECWPAFISREEIEAEAAKRAEEAAAAKAAADAPAAPKAAKAAKEAEA